MTPFNDERLKALERELLAEAGQCPFVIDPPTARKVELRHFSGGRDATYVVVSRNSSDSVVSSGSIFATIQYATFVEGTTIIYDATDETLQGKARPFVCDVTRQPARVYALLPMQIEEIVIAVKGSGDAAEIQAAFHDARGEAIEAALPLELRVFDSRGISSRSEYGATDRHGRFSRLLRAFDLPAKIAIRSLLTGREESLTL